MRDSAGMCSSVMPSRSSSGRTGSWWRPWARAAWRAAMTPWGSTSHCRPQLRRIRPASARCGWPQTEVPRDTPGPDQRPSPADRPIVAVSPSRRQWAMVQRVTTERFDDLDGSPAVETVRFGYAGRSYEIDLNEEHASQLDEVLAPYVEHARRADEGGDRQRRGRSAEKGRERRSDTGAIRRWAREQGLQVSD